MNLFSNEIENKNDIIVKNEEEINKLNIKLNDLTKENEDIKIKYKDDEDKI